MNTSNGKPVQLLLVEDNPTDAMFTLMALSQAGYTRSVRWVKDGEEAMQWLFAEGPCARSGSPECYTLVLVDIQLPKYSGLEVLARMKSTPRTREVPVVLLTSTAQPETVKAALALGAAECVQKPMSLDEYLALVQRLAAHWAGPPEEAPTVADVVAA